MRKVFVAGNWKMNTTRLSGLKLVKDVSQKTPPRKGLEIAVCPPSVYLEAVVQAVAGTALKVGAQNCYTEAEGAFTGEVAAPMLADIGCAYVIVGHSERRHILGETDEFISKKVKAALGAGLGVILCVGELLEERRAGKTNDVVGKQVKASLFGLDPAQMGRITVAYEPVWAIGTGVTATPEDASDVHRFIRGLVAGKFGPQVAEELTIQYGGSVKPDNALDLMSKPDIDGALVGGASLKTDSFVGIIDAAVKAKKL